MTAQQLKNAILQLAVQGKLVPQDPNDEPASVLLERIRAEKEQLIRAGRIKREKNPSVIFRGADNIPYEKIGEDVRSLADYAPFEIPDTWEWVRVGDLFTNMSGLSYKKELLDIKADQMVRVMRGGNIGDEHYSLRADDVFISSEFVKPELFLKKNYMITPAVSSLEHIGKIALIDKDLENTVVGGFVLMLIPFFTDDVLSKYLLYAFAAKHHRDNCRSITHKSGQAFYNLSRELLMNLPVPLPPHSEMERIVTKLEEVLPFVNSYHSIENASNELNEAFPTLLKKAILQWAVQGKLVPQDENDEPAEVLLARIRAEKEALIKTGRIKRDKHESVIFRRDNSHYEKLGKIERCIDEEIPFEIPNTWVWVPHNELFEVSGGSQPPKSKFSESPKPGYVRLYQIRDYGPNPIPVYIPESMASKTTVKGDILLARYGASLGKVFFAEDGAYNVAMAKLIKLYSGDLIDDLYLYYYYQSDIYQSLVKGNSRSAQAGFNKEDLDCLWFPLPPLAEQQRIVAKIEELMSLIKTM